MTRAATAEAPRERPILFSAPMVRAILDGKKAITRRVVKPQPFGRHVLSPAFGTSPDGAAIGTPWVWIENGPDYPDGPEDERRCPYGVPGDRLWVRETLRKVERRYWTYSADGAAVTAPILSPRRTAMAAWAHHKDGDTCVSIHMPRWASRLTLEVTDVRVERLQQIGELEAENEIGVTPYALGSDAIPRFVEGWDALNAKRGFGWYANPWVWVVSFRRVTD
jgi:hypothetical protein